jgi:hypothetical protein
MSKPFDLGDAFKFLGVYFLVLCVNSVLLGANAIYTFCRYDVSNNGHSILSQQIVNIVATPIVQLAAAYLLIMQTGLLLRLVGTEEK